MQRENQRGVAPRRFPFPLLPVTLPLAPSPPPPFAFALYLSGVCPVRLLCVFPALLPGCLAQFFNSIFCISHACTGHGTHGDGRAAGRGWNHHLNNSTFAACLDASRLSPSPSSPLSISFPSACLSLCRLLCWPGPGLVYLPPFHLAARSFPRASRASNDENFVINK